MKELLAADRVRLLLNTPNGFNRLANFGSKAKKKLSPEKVRDIRARWEAGEKLASIANLHSVSVSCVSLIGTRQRRADVK